MNPALSYAHGASSVSLLGETIGANLERTARRLPDAEALVCCHQAVRWSYRELDERVDALARGLVAAGLQVGDRVGIWSPNCAEWVLVQFATAKAGIILVNINPAYRATELAYALRQSACRMLVAAPSFKGSDYAAMIEQVRGELPELERVVLLDSPEWERLAAGEQATAGELRARSRGAAVRRPDQHPVHERDDGLSQGGDAQPPQHPQQRLLRRRGVRLHRGRPGLHPGALLPLLRHGHGQPRLRHPRRVHGRPRPSFEPRARAGGRRGRALHEPVRRPDDVHRRARRPGLRVL